MEPRLRNAIARIEVIQQGRVGSRGTGFLVADSLVLTALHVVAEPNKQPLCPRAGEITLTFPFPKKWCTKASIHEKCWDPFADWVMLQCEHSPPDAEPLPLAELHEDGVKWETFGFPDANPDGMVITGEVANCRAMLKEQRVFQLFSREAAAGQGARLQGLSGGPVLVQNGVVGLLRVALVDSEEKLKAVAGTVYACPLTSVRGLPTRKLPNHPKQAEEQPLAINLDPDFDFVGGQEGAKTAAVVAACEGRGQAQDHCLALRGAKDCSMYCGGN